MKRDQGALEKHQRRIKVVVRGLGRFRRKVTSCKNAFVKCFIPSGALKRKDFLYIFFFDLYYFLKLAKMGQNFYQKLFLLKYFLIFLIIFFFYFCRFSFLISIFFEKYLANYISCFCFFQTMFELTENPVNPSK